jgi:hypothetical protein
MLDNAQNYEAITLIGSIDFVFSKKKMFFQPIPKPPTSQNIGFWQKNHGFFFQCQKKRLSMPTSFFQGKKKYNECVHHEKKQKSHVFGILLRSKHSSQYFGLSFLCLQIASTRQLH